jgi:hypothetical protein
MNSGPFGRGNLVLYYEDENIDATFARVAAQVALIHSFWEQSNRPKTLVSGDPAFVSGAKGKGLCE